MKDDLLNQISKVYNGAANLEKERNDLLEVLQDLERRTRDYPVGNPKWIRDIIVDTLKEYDSDFV